MRSSGAGREYSRKTPNGLQKKNDKHPSRSSHARPAVKLCYGLDGRAGGLEGLPPPPAWQDWAQRQLAKHGSVSAFPLSLHEAGPSASVL